MANSTDKRWGITGGLYVEVTAFGHTRRFYNGAVRRMVALLVQNNARDVEAMAEATRRIADQQAELHAKDVTIEQLTLALDGFQHPPRDAGGRFVRHEALA